MTDPRDAEIAELKEQLRLVRADQRYVEDLRARADRERARWEHDTLVRTDLQMKVFRISVAWYTFRAIGDRWFDGKGTDSDMDEGYAAFKSAMNEEIPDYPKIMKGLVTP